jgi:molybdenum cofactor cytidylyltransferase
MGGNIFISAIILAAGESKRMGQPKLLMPFGKTTILGQTVDNYLNSRVNETIVIVGDKYKEISALLRNRSIRVIRNSVFQAGMGTSIVAGVSSANVESHALIIGLGDQPLIDIDTINHLITQFVSHSEGIVYPVVNGMRGHPVIFSVKYKAELLLLEGDMGGREVIRRHPDDVLEIPVDCEEVSIDIDTPDNYTQARLKYKFHKMHVD